MTLTSLTLLLPIIVLAITIVLVMLAIAVHRTHALSAGLTLSGIFLSALTIPLAWRSAPERVTSLLMIDRLGLLYTGILLFAAFAVALISYTYLRKRRVQPEEYYLLLLLASLGAMILAVSNHFAALFIGLEILSVSLYALVGYLRDQEHSIEAAIKYLILAASSSAFLMFGGALIYLDQGELIFDHMALSQAVNFGVGDILLLTGFGMLFVGIGFKLALVPFHMWTPDVYQGAPAPISGFIATVSKGAVFALLLRLSTAFEFQGSVALTLLLSLVAILSMLGGNLLALLQDNVKRILAYSSIAHLGYLLVAFLANSQLAILAVTFYLGAYFVTILGAFGIVSVLSGSAGEAEELADYRGLFWRRPWLAALFTLTLLSLIGMPMTAGFIGKFYLLNAAVGSSLWLLVIVLVIGSGIGLYYYLRIIVTMFLQSEPQTEGPMDIAKLPLHASLMLVVLLLLLLGIGIYPQPLIALIQTMLPTL